MEDSLVSFSILFSYVGSRILRRHAPHRMALRMVFVGGFVGALLIPTLVANSSAQSFIAKEHLTVFDANDVKVGDVIGVAGENGGAVWVAFKIEGQLAVLRVFRHSLKGPPTTEGFFVAEDCAGIPYFKDPFAAGANMLPNLLIASPGATVYAMDPDELSTTFYPQSKLAANGKCEKVKLINPVTLRPSRALVDLQEIFSPPFAIR